MGFFSKAKIKSSDILEQAVSYLSEKYDQAESTFSVASPFGQLLVVIANLSELIFSYISHTAEELNIQTAKNVESIFGLSRLVGHDPYRGASAYGDIYLKLNTSAPGLINGNTLIINNFTRLRISETGETYFLNLNSDYIKLSTSSNEGVSVTIIQGTVETQVFTSDGTALQTFNPIIKSMTDNDNVAVTVNGEEWTKVESLYDMPADDGEDGGKCFMAKSSINVGLTIIFGNGNFGKIPPNGAEIIVTYIKTAGENGNVYSNDMTVKFIDEGYDEYGTEVSLDDVLDVSTIFPPSLGTNFESPEFTKLIAPKTSKSYVLANPENYTTFLQKYNQFSFIYAYNTKDEYDEVVDADGNVTYVLNTEDDNITYLKVLPNIKKKIGNNEDYFDLPASEFQLSENEKDSLASAIQNSGRQLIGTELQLQSVTFQKFVINVIIRWFETASKEAIRSDIRSLLSKYFLNINRNDIIPVSDLIALIETVDGVDTCDVFFVTEKNEEAKKLNGYWKTKNTWTKLRYVSEPEWVTIGNDEEPRVGFDSFGNIVSDGDEFYIPKGGFEDADGHYYTETIETGKLGPLNIFFLSSVEYTAYNQSMQKKLNNLLNS